jgi:hypothetical protein
MILAIDFDGTVVVQDHSIPYDDVETPLRFMHGAKETLEALKNAGHVLLLWSARASHALRFDPQKDPLVRAGVRQWYPEVWEASREVNEARYQQMLDFVAAELPGVFDAIDDGSGSKPICDLFVDDKAVSFGKGLNGMSWYDIASVYGEPGQP